MPTRSTRWPGGGWRIVRTIALLASAAGTGSLSARGAARADDTPGLRPGLGPIASPGVVEATCPGELRLVASVVMDARPDLSLAMVRSGTGEGAAMINVGGRVAGYTLSSLERDRAHLRSPEGTSCTLFVFGSRTARPASPRAAQASATAAPDEADPPKGKPVFSGEELARGVRPLGGDRYRIDRPLFLRALGNPGGAAGGAYFRAVERDSRVVGMEVRGVRTPSPLSAMGIRSGDVVLRVNGIALDDAVELLSALRDARQAELVTLQITRDGAERMFQYQVD
jgi:PDZ domain